MINRITQYSEYIIQIYDGYFNLRMLGNNQLNVLVYDNEWMISYKQYLNSLYIQMLDLSLSDLKNSDQASSYGTDLRKYLYRTVDVQMLVDTKVQNVKMNFENLIRLYYIAINNTLSDSVHEFANFGNNHYFYFIFQNYDTFTNQIRLNFQNGSEMIKNTLENCQR